MTEFEVSIADDAYVKVQQQVKLVCELLIDPKLGLGEPTLDLFIERAQRSLDLGPILHPSEFRVGADHLREVLTHARALRDARELILEASGL